MIHSRLLQMVVLIVGFPTLVHAQTFTRAVQSVSAAQLAPTDSIVQVIAEAQGLQLVPPGEAPIFGTFWLVLSSSRSVGIAPLPCPPLDPSLPIYAIADGQFLVDGTTNTGDANAAVLAAQSNAVVNLITQIQPADANKQIGVMNRDVPMSGAGGEYGDGSGYANSYILYTIDTNALWLEITNISNGQAYLNLHNATNQVYEIWSKTDLLATNWSIEQAVWPATNQDFMPFTVPQLARTNLFIWARDWTGIDENSNGIQDWWEWKYFGNFNQPTNSDYDSDGVDNLTEYQSGSDPNTIKFSLRFPNDHVSTSVTYGNITVLGGIPSSMALLVNSTNYAGANWQPFNSNVVVPLNSGDGNYDVRIGLRGFPQDAQQTWQWAGLVLDTMPATITVTNPTAGVISSPVIQVQGYASEPLNRLVFDVSNAAGVITNQEGYLLRQFYDTNLLAFTTNSFQCYDVGLTSGLNTITLHATDLAGNTAAASFSVTLDYSSDTTPPALTVVWPQEGMSIGGDTFTLRGVMNDETAHVAVSGLTVNPVEGIVQRDGQFWIANLPLTNGDNTLTVTATDAAGNSTTNSFTVFESDVTLVINPVSGDDLKQSAVTVYGTISDASYGVWVNGVEATVSEDGTWEADNVPVSGSGIAVFDAVAHPPGAAPTFAVRPMDAGGGSGSEVDQSLVQVTPSLVQVTSYQENWNRSYQINYNGGGAAASLERTVAWTLGVGGYSHQHSVGSPYGLFDGICDSYVEWPTNWPGGETLEGVCCDGGYSESPNPAWQYCSVNQSFPTSGDDGVGGLYYRTDALKRKAQTRIELVVSGQIQANAQQIILLTTSAAEYSWPAVYWFDPFPARYPGNIFDGAGDVPLPASAIRILGQTPITSATDDTVGELILTLPAGAVQDITPTVVYPLNQNYYSFDVQVTDVHLQLAVDANRDGDITFDTAGQANPDHTTTANAYRFWVNNDRDGYCALSGETDVQDDLDPSSGTDTNSFSITCTRDLEDYTRLWINTQGITTEVQNGTFLLALEWKDASGEPAMQLFRAAETNGGMLYLTDTNKAQQQFASYGTRLIEWRHLNTLTKYNPFIFPTNFWANVSSDQPVAHLLFDAVSRGSGKLVVSIYTNDGETKLAESQPLYLKLQDIKEMYERWTVGDGPDGTGSVAPATNATISTDRLPDGIGPFQYDWQSTETNTYILFVHGWNMFPWEKDAWAETMFKRLYWQGYKGRFGAFQWPTTYHNHDILALIDFDMGEYRAWQSSVGLEGLLNSLYNQYGNNVYVLAHSMGNIVVGEALRRAAQDGLGQLMNTYVASQAAVPGNCYDSSLSGSDLLDFGSLGPTTANIYNNWLATNSAAVGTKANFYNVNDFALNVDHWQLDEKMKPDSVAGIHPPYGYRGTPGDNPPWQDGFYGTYIWPLQMPLYLGSVTNVQDRYEITAFAAEPRSKALGGITSVAGFSPQNMQSIWPPDPFGNHDYGTHPWHSAEFRFTNMEQKIYWDQLLKTLKLKASQ